MNKHLIACAISLPLLAAPWLCAAADASRAVFGTMPDGRKVEVVTLDDGHGFTARVISLGASLQSLMLPDRDGKLADVVLAYPDLHDYLAKPQYFGATVGRFANRIAGGRFTLDGKSYQLTLNDGPNSLHGGAKGFDKVVWQVMKVVKSPEPSVTLRYVSPDGDQGYPGTLTATATYTLKAGHELDIDYSATTDKPTIVNLSNHAYWNLGGEGSVSVYDDILTIPGDSITPVDDTLIPTGEFRTVAGTDYDFRRGKPIGRDIRDGKEQQLLRGHGYDMNWVISRTEASAPRLVAKVEDPRSGRVLTLYSAQPGLQFYSGNFLDGTSVGKSGRIYRQGDAFVLEPQRFPDTPNHPDFGSARLAPGQTYHNHIVYRFSVDGGTGR
ncbi:galactose mutarotase [Rhodanobacter sp. C06]|uniref:aldose epimerase family protein n=1 Tax=Rhodanobacter sp. C06 TaxID=1945854 RepID=UPI0009853352|nr:aldose epimerase family protein [Rhodanobacter sp. C06]OOG36898.1 galactose mutarotase [Rhodanobacter sp. C06]